MVVQAQQSSKRRWNNGLANFTQWKQEAMDKLLKDDVLMKLMCYPTEDCLVRPNVTQQQRKDLIYKQIYPYKFADQIAEKKMSYISLGMSNFVPQEGFRQFSDDYMQGYLYFYILVDRGILKTKTGVRSDLILDRVYRIFQGQQIFGMGEARVEAMVENWQQNNDFGGYTLGFRVVDMK